MNLCRSPNRIARHLAALTPATSPAAVEARGYSTGGAALAPQSLQYLTSIGMTGAGVNANSGNVCLGGNQPNRFNFKNSAGTTVILVMWEMVKGDYQAIFMNARQAAITYTLAPDAGVTVSVANGISGGWAAVHVGSTKLTANGQIDNTQGEYTTGPYGTIDVTREIQMNGHDMSIQLSGSNCRSDGNTCVFTCKSGSTCGESGSYDLTNCNPNKVPGANNQMVNGNPEGGCQGFANGGDINVTFKANMLSGTGAGSYPSQPSATGAPAPAPSQGGGYGTNPPAPAPSSGGYGTGGSPAPSTPKYGTPPGGWGSIDYSGVTKA